MRYLIIFCACMGILSCSAPSVEESIIGKWNYDHVDFKATANNTKLSDYERENIAEAAIKIQNMYVEFYNDKTFDVFVKMEGGEKNEHGTYAIEGDGKYIATSSKSEYGSEKTERLEIVRLTADSLTLISGKGAYVVYAKAK